jgi:hypothetical protein
MDPADASAGLFASTSLREHLLRGAGAGLALFALSELGPEYSWLALLLGAVALWLMRGCPLCWTMGLYETIRARLKRPTRRG